MIAEDGDIYGDGVNIAARIESIAQPGGVAVSASVRDHVGNKLELTFEDMGEQTLKNIEKPVRVYNVLLDAAPLYLSALAGIGASVPAKLMATPGHNSIAVLPFVNMSGDAEQEFFTDGLTEDIITDLSNAPGFFVIARNSTFAYKGKPADVRQIARDLGVKYILEGSARRSDKRLRINVQLIDAAEGGNHVWAERFDRDLVDIFAAQDEVTRRVIEAIAGKLGTTQIIERYRPTNLEAYDLCARGRSEWRHSDEAGAKAHALFERAIELEPGYAETYRWLALGQCLSWLHFNAPMHPARELALVNGRKAVELDPADAANHSVLGFVLMYDKRLEEAEAELQTALRLNPNEADAWYNLSDLRVMEGRGLDAVDCSERSLRLNPQPMGAYYWLYGQALFAAGQYEAAVKTLRREETYRTGSRRFLAAALAELGRLEEAREEGRMFMAANPHFTIKHWIETQPFRDLDMRDRFVQAYRLAGLPE